MHTNQWVLKVTCCEWQALKIETGRRYAVKMIDTTNRAFEMSALRKEIDTMQRIDHINCIHLHGVFEEDKYICLVLDLVTGGELFDRIIARGHYSERMQPKFPEKFCSRWRTCTRVASCTAT